MTKTSHEDFMRIAIELSSVSGDDRDGRPFGAIVVLDDQIVGSGRNQSLMRHDPTAHAEILAIREACSFKGNYRIDGAEIYCSSEPCPMCLCAIYWSGINRVYYGCTSDDTSSYGFKDSYFYHQLALPRTQREISSTQLMREHAVHVLAEWHKSKYL